MLVKCIDASDNSKIELGKIYKVLNERYAMYDLRIDGYDDVNCRGFFKRRFEVVDEKAVATTSNVPTPDRVIFNGPATIIFWSDGDKTLVKKTDDDVMDAEKAFLVSFYEKMSGLSRTQCNKTLGRIVAEYDAQIGVVEGDVDEVDDKVLVKLKCVKSNDSSHYIVGNVYEVILSDRHSSDAYIVDECGSNWQVIDVNAYEADGISHVNKVIVSNYGFEIADGEA